MRPGRYPLLVAALAAALLTACSPAPEADTQVPSTAGVAPGATPGAVESPPQPAPAAPFAPPSFDCAAAEGDMQKLICADQRLAELDSEIGRLVALAGADAGLDPAGRDALLASQSGWSERRNECAKAEGVRSCALGESVVRIFQLRQGHAAARADDGGGISRGPSAWKCVGLDVGLSSVYVNGEPSSLALAWKDRVMAMEGYPEPDGVRYAGADEDRDYLFLVTGTRAMFAQPGQPALSCEVQPAG